MFAGCGGGTTSHPDGAGDSGRPSGDASGDGAADRPIPGDAADRPGSGDSAVDLGGDGGPTGPRLPDGKPCTLAGDCQSGFCADGVCCNSACTGTCLTCAAQGGLGTCLPAEVGTDPRNECDDQGIATCGNDGVCDGAGACRKYPAGISCRAASCSGSTMTLAFRCNGTGACKPTSGQPCDPYMCGTDDKCLLACTVDADCTAPNSCNGGSCGKRPLGGTCATNDDCNSGICAQGVCCQTTCTGMCQSCAVSGSAGTCTSVPAGEDPLGQCADQGASTCGTNGSCDGAGACQPYAKGTTCVPPSCSTATATLAGRCDGAGVCTPGTQQPCGSYMCSATTGTCLAACATNADCTAGNVCNGTICGKKVTGVDCTTPGECASGFCQQGVCCGTACTGTCLSCALAGNRGVCSPIAAGQDPLNQCADAGQASCGTDGACNGAGACRLYAPGNSCMPPTCSGSTVTLAGRCDGAGNCLAGTLQTCSPYMCGTTGGCLASCTGSSDCTASNVCSAGSCGKKPLGAACGAAAECGSAFCEQGVCCGTACRGNCMSCALSGTGGTCSTVPAGQDPLNQCTDAGAAGCGTDGACDGMGGCHIYASGTQCAAGSCTGATYTPPRTCNGAGVCQPPAGLSCGAYSCGTNGLCLTRCSTNTDCVAPNVCNGGVCSKKPIGGTCAAGTECDSGLCQQGVCCSSSCSGTCRSCALAGSAGTCTLVPVGQDPLNQCTDNGATTCGTNGSCDGNGACQLYAAGTTCASSSCTGATFTPARTCNGTGTCLTATSSTCDPYMCGTNAACRTTCATTADCTSPNSCNSMSCGKKPIGGTCATAVECNSGFCAQGVCCASACTGTCQSCSLTGSVGTCASVPAGQDPLNQCTDLGAATCGTDGSCDGSGGCRRYANGTTCAASTCTGTTLTPARTCDGAGTCKTVTTQSCGAYVCGGSGSCLTMCATSNDCVTPNVCSGTSCTKKPNGATCSAPGDCASGFCEQGACCISACTGSCRSCNLAGTAGTCTLVVAGDDPLGQCADSGASSCGTDGTCDGGGACRLYASGTTCGAASCTGSTYTPARACSGTGTCQTATPMSCGAYVCGGSTCKGSCTVDADCVAPNVCVGGACTKKPPGVACSVSAECASGFCQQSVCCTTACTGTCQSCALAATAGTCSNVPTGQDPLGQCTDAGATTCGMDGACNGAGACRLYGAGTVCVAASCTGSTTTPARTCNGTGTCQAVTTTACDPYVCGATACKTTCTVDTDCISAFICSGGSCVKKAVGATCASNSECALGFCAQGVCCQTACGGTCQSCALAGTVGTCTNVPAGQDPQNQCTDAGAASCGNDGFCNGAGACRNYGAGTQCVAASCSGSTLTSSRTCDGSGVCQAATSTSCSPYVCGSSTACRTTCGTTADCASPNVCNGTSCGKKAVGTACGGDAECNSNVCAQGVCCQTACTGLCLSCAVTGSLGTCSNVPAGQDPQNQCTDAGAASCGNDGFCNGAGACRNYAAGTQCAAATCTGSTASAARMCNGTGTCQAAATSPCDPYLCGATACKTTCAADTDCNSPNVCNGTVCSKKTNGSTCTTTTECASNFCSQGICCATNCTGTCQSCALTGTLGTCTNVPAGQDPQNQCTDAGAATCGLDGFCNGSGGCRFYTSGTQCAAPSCSVTTATSSRTCNGTGTCGTATTAMCNPYICGPTACKTTCATTADCVSPNVCIGTTCGPAPGLKVQYMVATQSQFIKPHLKIVNAGTAAVALSTLTMRYWFTIDSTATPLPTMLAACDFAQVGCNNTSESFVAVTPARTGADNYFQIGFAAGAGSLAAGANTGEIQLAAHKSDFSVFTETNDYSFDATKTAYADWTKVTLYQNGTLIWGTEP